MMRRSVLNYVTQSAKRNHHLEDISVNEVRLVMHGRHGSGRDASLKIILQNSSHFPIKAPNILGLLDSAIFSQRVWALWPQTKPSQPPPT